MKRTPLKPSLTRIRQHRAGSLRKGPMRNRKYRLWLTTRWCIVCIPVAWRRPLIDPAHTSNNGLSSKGPDSSCVPLCREHHEAYDSGREAFEVKYNVSMVKEAAIHYALFLSEAA